MNRGARHAGAPMLTHGQVASPLSPVLPVLIYLEATPSCYVFFLNLEILQYAAREIRAFQNVAQSHNSSQTPIDIIAFLLSVNIFHMSLYMWDALLVSSNFQWPPFIFKT